MELKVVEALAEDIGKGLARLDPGDMSAADILLGDVIEIIGGKKTVARVTGAITDTREKNTIRIDGITRCNAGVSPGDTVQVKKIPRKTAVTVVLSPLDPQMPQPSESELEHFGKILQGLPLIDEDKINVPFFGGKERFFNVQAVSPAGGVIVNQHTKFVLRKTEFVSTSDGEITYDSIGGLERELSQVREMVELPLRHAGIFEKLGVEAPKGVLLYGPPGTGKTLIARAIASETKLHFIMINGPEIINKYYGESEARLREIFEEAAHRAPSIIFIDEIDAIAPKRAAVLGDVEKRVVAQLLALMDGVVSRGHVIVIGATNVPEMIDPALRRPGRFDREVSIPVPDKEGRLSILRIHSRRMPLAPDVDLEHFARITYGFVGADLAALCKEAAIVTLRRHLVTGGKGNFETAVSDYEDLQITKEDFFGALREIDPTATREFFTERSSVKWDQVGGLHDIKEKLVSLVEWPYRYPEVFRAGNVRPPNGILFTGPSGTGKTLMVKALAGESGLNFISISGPILFSKWLGESEKALHEIFKKAKQSAPCILFFDEFDALAVKRSGATDGGTIERMASQFFSELDNLSGLSQVVVIGATNREDLIDPSALRSGRLDFVIRFHIPDREDRIEIFRVHTAAKPLATDVDINKLAAETGGMVGSQIAFICERAAMMAISELINASKESNPAELSISMCHFNAAIWDIKEERGRSYAESSREETCL